MTAKPPADHKPYPAYEKRWPALFTILMAMFMNLLDVTIVNVSLPSLQKDMGASSTEIEWVVAGFIVTFALGLLPFGRYGDIVGKKKMFLFGVAAFTLASILCGAAPNIEFLVTARVIQGAAGAIMTPQVLSIAQTIFPPHERAAAFSLFGLTAGLASVIGPVLGGLLLNADLFGLTWRPIFLMNIPVGILALVLGAKFIPTIPGHIGMRNDFGGILIVCAAMFLLIFPLIEGSNYAWASWCFLMMAGSAAMFVLFVFWESRQNRHGQPQLLPVTLMKNRNFIIGAFMSLTFFSAIPPFFLIFALYLQSGFGLNPLWSGITTLPFSIGVLIASAISGRIGAKWQRERIAAGIATIFVGILSLRFIALVLTDNFHYAIFVLPLLIAGIGLGVAMSPLFQTILSGVPVKDAGSGSGALQAIQQAGGAFGVAIVSQIFFGKLAAEFASGAIPTGAYTQALTTAVIYNLICYIIVFLCVFALKNPPQITGSAGAEQAAPVLLD
jgi:EmrB/QacA subfamily drug resistance transporter